jgi:2,3-dihydroxybiphenyl 1,2-dioxygenase
MTAAVRSLGYAIVTATDLDAWQVFACDLLGLQAVERTSDRLLLRADEKAYRLDIRKGDIDGVTTLGWEVGGAAELEELAQKLEAAGYAVKREDALAAREARQVSGLVTFDDPDGVQIELHYGLKDDKNRFVSPTGAHFVTGTGGLGHAFQLTSDAEAFGALYFDILGFRLSDHIEFGPIDATFMHCNPRHHSQAYAQVPGAPVGVGHLMFEVDDLDFVGRAYDKVLAGAAPLAMSFGRHSNDNMTSFYVRTPSGFQIEYGYGGLVIDEDTWTPHRYDVPSFWGHARTDPDEIDI